MVQKLFFLLSMGIVVLVSLPLAYAELYKYIDENGTVSYTDNLSKASEFSKKAIEVINEISTEKTEQKEDIEDAQIKESGQTKTIQELKTNLDQEYSSCTIEQDKLVQEKETIKTNEEKIEFNKKVEELNKRIEAYTEKNKAYQKLVDEYNKSISNK